MEVGGRGVKVGGGVKRGRGVNQIFQAECIMYYVPPHC
jgi:hypothetical protein